MPLWRPRWYSEPVVPGDLTVIMLTLNKPPKHWQAFYKRTLLQAIGDRPLVIISKEPVDWQRPNTQYGTQDEPATDEPSRYHNIYTQLLKAAKMADTPYVATCDDDCCYPAEHFDSYRPPLNKFSYNYCRWSINEWNRDNPFFYHSPNPDNPMFIAPRQKLIDDMEAMQAKHASNPDFQYGKGTTEFMLDCVTWYSIEPIVCFHHVRGVAGERIKRWKRPWPVQALSLPRWGAAAELVKEWREED
jgi:hypothetical protein